MDTLILYLSYPFVRYALIVGVLIALCASLLGVTLVLKRFSFIGDGLSHVAFGAMAIAAVLNMTNRMVIVLPVTVVCAVLLLRTGQNTKIKGDAAIAMISVGALAFGYLLMSIFSTSSNLSGDVCGALFGSTSILTLTKGEVWLCIGLSALVLVLFTLFYQRIFDVTFDETFAKAAGTQVDAANLLIHRRHHRAGHESGRLAADFCADYLPGAVRHADFPLLPVCHGFRRRAQCSLRLCRHCCLHSGRHACGFHGGCRRCGRLCPVCRSREGEGNLIACCPLLPGNYPGAAGIFPLAKPSKI